MSTNAPAPLPAAGGARHLGTAGYALLLAIFLVYLPLGNHLGWVADPTLNLWGRNLCFALAALGIDLIWGYCGVLSLCHAFFFCIGGYCIGMHLMLMIGKNGVNHSELPDFMVWNSVKHLPAFWEPFHSLPLTIALAILLPGLAAGIFGYFAFRSRIRGVYFSVITQALALAMWLLFLRNETMLGGTNGFTGFMVIAGFPLSPTAVGARPGYTAHDTMLGLYLITVVTVILALLLCRFVVRSKLGKLLIAIRDSEHRLRFTGYNITSYKVTAFILGAVLAGIAGLLYVPQTNIITPGRMDVQASIEMVIWAAVGGRGTLIGPVLGALGVTWLYNYLTGSGMLDKLFFQVTHGHLADKWPFLLGSLFVVVVLFFPHGLVGTFRQPPAWFHRLRARLRRPATSGGAP